MRTIKEGEKVFILQMGSNAHGMFLLFFELLHGRRRGNIMILEGRMGSGWSGFSLHLRRALEPTSLAGQGQPHRQSKPIVVAAGHSNHSGRYNIHGGGIKGKEKVTVFQNLKTYASSSFHRDQCKL